MANLSQLLNYNVGDGTLQDVTSRGSDTTTGATFGGNVGIGTDVPTSPLEIGVNAVSGGFLDFRMTSGITDTARILFSDGTIAGQIRYDHSDDSMAFRTVNTEAMRIDASGNVGIGATTVNAKLHLKANDPVIRFEDDEGGAARTYEAGSVLSSFVVKNIDQGTQPLTILDSGNVGIGTTSPTSLLEVNDSSSVVDVNIRNEQAAGDARLFLFAGVGGDSRLRFRDADDADVGEFIYSHSGDYLATRVNGAERMRIDSTGDVVIGSGVTTPAARLEVYTGVNGDLLKLTGSTITGRGLVISAEDSGGTQGASFRYTAGSTVGEHIFANGTAEQMRITSSGNVLVGTTAAIAASGTRLQVESDASNDRTLDTYIKNSASTQATIAVYSDVGGTKLLKGYARAGGDWFQVSDRRQKEDINDITYGLDTVCSLRGVHYKWKGNDEAQLGFIAQEVMEEVPEVVSLNDDGFYGMSNANLVPVLVKAIQELTARVKQLEVQ